MGYSAELGLARSYVIGVRMGPNKIWDRWDPTPLVWGVADNPLPHRYKQAEFDGCWWNRQTIRAYVGLRRHQKMWPSHTAFQGQPRSSKVTRTERVPACWWSMITMGLSCTVSEINDSFSRKRINFFKTNLGVFNALLSVLFFEFCDSVSAQEKH